MAEASYHPDKQSRPTSHRLLVWLDRNIDGTSQETLKQLRSVISDLTLFTDLDECVDHLHGVTAKKVSVITSGSFAQDLVPDIHGLEHVDAIYIYCGNPARYEKWSRDWHKIEGVYTQIQPICTALARPTDEFDEDSIPMSFLSSTEDASSEDLDQLDPTFMYTQLFKSIILNMEYNRQAVADLTAYSRPSALGNEKELALLKEFRDTYRPETAVWWYTRECFLYRALNKALGLLNAEVIVKMGFFIQHLHRQLERLHEEQVTTYSGRPITVYRGQRLAKLAFDKANKGREGLMSFNNFLSTSFSKEVALQFTQKRPDKIDTVPVVFVMTIDPNITSTPFAKVQQLSFFEKEGEILFSTHSVFRINRINRIKPIGETSQLFEIHMTLTAESDPLLRGLTYQLENEIHGSTGWERIGELLIRLDRMDQAEELYLGLIRQTRNAHERALYNHCLGRIKNKQSDYEAALRYYNASLTIRLRTVRDDDPSLAACYSSIAMVYQNKQENRQALQYYEKALAIYQREHNENNPDLATCYSNIAGVYNTLKKHKRALEFYTEALTIYRATLPDNHHSVTTCFNSSGLVYKDLGDYPTALSYLEHALSIREKTLPGNHSSLATSCNNIGSVYYATREYAKALPFFERALAIRRAIFKPNHPEVLVSRKWIATVKRAM